MDYLSVKNLSSYQHYKHRRPPWVKLHRSMLESYDFGRLQDASKWLAVGLTLVASECENRIPNDAEWIAKRLQMSTVPDIESLLSMGFLTPYVASKPQARRKQNGGSETEAEREKEKRVRTTWLTPAMQAWEAKFGPKSFPFGPAARHLAPLSDADLTPDQIGFRLAAYLDSLDDLKFASLPRFAATHGQYANGAPVKLTAADAMYAAVAAEANDASQYLR